MFHFYALWNIKIAKGFLMFSGGIEMEQSVFVVKISNFVKLYIM